MKIAANCILWLLLCVVVCTSCSEENEIDNQTLVKEKVSSVGLITLSKEDVVDTIDVEMRQYIDNNNKAAVPIVRDAGSVVIDGQKYYTAIIGNQRWITEDYSNEIEYDEDFETWTAPSKYRGNHYYIGDKDLPLEAQFLREYNYDIDAPDVHFYIYSLAMLLDERLGEKGFVKRDKLISTYKKVDNWHIPSEEEDLALLDMAKPNTIKNVLDLTKTGLFYHQTNDSSNVMYYKNHGDQYAAHWNREYTKPQPRGGVGPYGTWTMTIYDLSGNQLFFVGPNQNLEPILPIRLVQTVELK